jgi:hypothetical protein
MWDLNTGQKLARFPGGRKQTESVHMGHCTTINAVAVSTDSQFLVSFNFSEFSILKQFPSQNLNKSSLMQLRGIAFYYQKVLFKQQQPLNVTTENVISRGFCDQRPIYF